MAKKRRNLWHYAAALALIALGWELLAILLNEPAFPRLWPATQAFVQQVSDGPLLMHTWASFRRVAFATVLSLALGLPVGLYLGRSGGPIATLVVYILHPVPKVVFLPVIIVLLGIEDTSKIFLISLILFFQVIVTVRDAAAGVSDGLIQSVRSLGASELSLYRHVILPACLPKVFTALRISVGTAVAVLFFAETYATTEGLGAYVWDSWAARAFSEMFAGVQALALLGFGLYLALELLERKVCPWEYLND